MKLKLSLLVLMLFIGPEPGLLQQANSAFEAGDYAACLQHYQQALKVYPEQRASIQFNMGLVSERLDSNAQAMIHYHQALKPQYPEAASQAANNLGILLLKAQKYPEALQSFKDALVYLPENEHARFNYELLLRMMQQRTSDQDNQSSSDPSVDPNSGSQPPSTQGQSPPSRTSRSRYRRLPSTENAGAIIMDTIPLARAQEMLDRMRQHEIRFLQQLRKIPANPLPRNDARKDW